MVAPINPGRIGRFQSDRDVEIGRSVEKFESARQNADDSVEDVIKSQRLAQDRGVAAEPVLPQLIAKHRCAVSSRLIFHFRESATENWLRADERKERRGNFASTNQDRLA